MTIVVTGATGLVGGAVVKSLVAAGTAVRIITRNPTSLPANLASLAQQDGAKVDAFGWNELPTALASTRGIIHLAGANIVTHSWSESRRKLLVDSRINTLEQLAAAAPKGLPLVSASAVGIYGSKQNHADVSEEAATSDEHADVSTSSPDFPASICARWEAAADAYSVAADARVVKLRIGLVMAPRCAAWLGMGYTAAWGVGAALGDGKQWIPFIHIDDLAEMFIHAVENDQLQGAYNACAPNPVTLDQFTREVASVAGMPYWLPRIPAFLLKTVLGERADLMLHGTAMSMDKWQRDTAETFAFEYPTVREMAGQLLERSPK